MFPGQNYYSLDKIYVPCKKGNLNHENDYLNGNYLLFVDLFQHLQLIWQI